MLNIYMIDMQAKKKSVYLARELVVSSMSSLSTLRFKMIIYQ